MSESPGWVAIDSALEPIYGTTKPFHCAAIPHYALGGKDPLDGISVYKNASGRHHWHYVTYGFSELYSKELDDPDVSGFGFELTFRLARTELEEEPPSWPLNLLQNLARYVFQTGRVFLPGHHLNCNGPIALAEETSISAILFAQDPQLGSVKSVHGQVEFVQIVGITLDELNETEEWNTKAFLEELRCDNAQLITDLHRESILADPARSARINERKAKDGSSTGMLFNDSIRWRLDSDATGEQLELTIGARLVPSLARLLRGRILHDRELVLKGKDGSVEFKSDSQLSWQPKSERELLLGISHAQADEIQVSIKPVRGDYRFASLPGFTLHVVPTEIKNQQGEIVEVIG